MIELTNLGFVYKGGVYRHPEYPDIKIEIIGTRIMWESPGVYCEVTLEQVEQALVEGEV